MRPSRRGLPPLGAVVEEHPTERPWRQGRRCIHARCVGDQHAGHAPRVLGDHRLERSQRPPEDRAGGSPVHDPCLASARPHAQSEPGNFAVLRHRLPSGWRREPLHPCVGDRCLCSHPAILSVRFGRDLRGNPAWGTPRTRRVTVSGRFGVGRSGAFKRRAGCKPLRVRCREPSTECRAQGLPYFLRKLVVHTVHSRLFIARMRALAGAALPVGRLAASSS